MAALAQGYKGMRVLMVLNWDRLFFAVALFLSLKFGSYLTLLALT